MIQSHKIGLTPSPVQPGSSKVDFAQSYTFLKASLYWHTEAASRESALHPLFQLQLNSDTIAPNRLGKLHYDSYHHHRWADRHLNAQNLSFLRPDSFPQ